MERQLWKASVAGKLGEIREILRGNPDININHRKDYTALDYACERGNPGFVGMLVAHPDIDVNLKNIFGGTSFLVACGNGHAACVRLLLHDLRVLINEPDSNGYTPLRNATFRGYLDVVRWMVASGRPLFLGQHGNRANDAIGAARMEGKKELLSLLERFRDAEEVVRAEVRRELGIAGETFLFPFFFPEDFLRADSFFDHR